MFQVEMVSFTGGSPGGSHRGYDTSRRGGSR
jgi:hypothetical protein